MLDDTAGAELQTQFLRLGVALAIGLLVGVERGWKDRHEGEGERTAGLRTHALIGLIGGFAGLLSMELGGLVLALGFAGFAAGATTFEYMRARKDGDLDATPLTAQLLVFALGAAAALGHIEIAGAAAVAATGLLAFKDSLHGWLRNITFKELRAGVLLAAMTVIVLPLLPAGPVDPWGAVSVRSVWLLTLLIAGISFVGYIAIRVAGAELGPLVAGAAGGLVSSTATVLSFSRLAKPLDAKTARPLLAGAVLANTVMFGRTAILAASLRNELILPIFATMIPAGLASLACAFIVARGFKKRESTEAASAVLGLGNPFSLKTALFFGVLLAAVSLATALASDIFGESATLGVAAISGLADVDAVTLSMTQVSSVSAETATLAILIAVGANTASKIVLSFLAGGVRTGFTILITSAITLAVGGAGYLVWMAFAP